MGKLKLNNVYEIILIGLFICVSGGVLFYIEYGEIFIPMFFLASTAYYFIKTPIKFNINIPLNSSQKVSYLTDKKFLVVVTFLFLLNSLLNFSNQLNLNEIIIFFMFLFGSYFMLNSITFKRFKKYFINWVCVICFFSIVIWGLGYLNVLPYTKKEINDTVYCLFWYHNLGWDYIQNRNSSIFWEPGVYQVVLNVAILLLLFSKRKLAFKEQLKLFLLLLGIVTTRSTTGYLVTMVILFVKFFKKINSYKNRAIVWCSLGVVSIILIIIILKTPTIINKFNMENYSFNQRYQQNIMSIKLILKHPFTGYGINSKALQNIMQNEYNLKSNSNGLFVITIYFGVIMTLVFIKKIIDKNKFDLLLLIVWLMINITEYFIIFPVSYIFIFNFSDEKVTI